MILVTGAAGKTGRAVIQNLVSRGAEVRSLVHHREQVGAVDSLGAADVYVGDMTDPTVLEEAAIGVDKVYHICPNVHPEEVGIGRSMIAAALNAGIQLFVYHSVLHPQVEAMPHHWLKLRVEEALFMSGLSYVVLQPAAYMQNILVGWEAICNRGVYTAPYPVDTRLGMVDLWDVAEAAAKVLCEPGHAGAVYELAGQEVLTQREIVGILAQVLDRPVRFERLTPESWTAAAREAGMGDYQVDTLLKMFVYYGRHGFGGNSKALTWLLERPPTDFATFVRRIVSAS